MFFKKKVQETVNRRRSYRKRRSPHRVIEVYVITPSGVTQGEFLDLSVQGLGARFPIEHDPQLAADDVVELTIESPEHGRVMTPARTVYGQPDEERYIRYGFEFINIGNLYSQLDSFYARLFNRRGSERVRPSLDQSVPITLTWGRKELEAQVHEISATGAGLVLPMADAFRLQGVDEVGVRFRLPGLKDDFRGTARILNRKQSGGKVFLGVAFDLGEESALRPLQPRLERFVEERAREIDRWEQSWE